MNYKSVSRKIVAATMAMALAFCSFGGVTTVDAATISAKQYIAKMTKAQKKVKSYELTQKSSTKMIYSGQTVSETTTEKETVFTKPLKAKITVTSIVNSNGVSQKQHKIVYLKETKSGKVAEYTSKDGKTFDKVEVNKEALNSVIQASGDGSFSNAKIVKNNVKVNGKNTVKISVEVTGKDLQNMMSSLGVSSDAINSTAIDYSKLPSIKGTYYIDKKTYLPVKITVDTKAFMNKMLTLCDTAMYEQLGGENIDVSSMIKIKDSKISTVYTKFNKAKNFSIPKSCK